MIQIGAIVLLIVALLAGKTAYDHNKQAEGRAQLAPLIAKMSDQLKADVAAFETITVQMNAIKADSERLKSRVAQALLINGKRQVIERDRIQYIDRVQPQGATECERTTDAIKQVLR